MISPGVLDTQGNLGHISLGMIPVPLLQFRERKLLPNSSPGLTPYPGPPQSLAGCGDTDFQS